MPVYKTKTEGTKDKKIWYFSCYVDYPDGSRKKYKSKKFATRDEATKAEALFIVSRNDKNKETKINEITFDAVWNDYHEVQKRKVRVTTLRKIENIYKHLDKIKNESIANLTLDKYRKFYNQIEKLDYSLIFKNKILALLKTINKHAYTYFGVSTPLIERVGFIVDPNEFKKEMKFYTFEEFNKFINKVDDVVYKGFFLLLYYSGIRLGEAQALTWKDIDFKNRTISINKNLTTKLKGEPYRILPPKTKKSNRTLKIPNLVIEHLDLIKKLYSSAEGFSENSFVFGMIKPLPDTTIKKYQLKAIKAANLHEIRIHDLRHSFASLMINSGANITIVSKYLGHSNISMTLNVYSHMFENKQDEIINIINNLTSNIST